MITFKEYLIEIKAPEVNISNRLLKSMPHNAHSAITSWEYSQWTTGELEQAYRSKNTVWKEVESYADQLRDVLRKQHGNTIRLYRGLLSGEDASKYDGRQLHSWTARKEIAAVFAGLARSTGGRDVKLNKDAKTSKPFLITLTDQQAKDIQNRVMRDGKAIYDKMLFKTSLQNPDYVDVYTRKATRGYSFFGDELKANLASWLIRRREDEKAYLEDYRSRGSDRGYVVMADIPVDDVVWVLNNGKTYPGTLEYIVKGNSGMKSKKVSV